MFVIDDGSTDNTKQIIEPYIKEFTDRGYNLYYFYQENGGVSSAINNGLKYINGEYLVWPDADDWYSSPYTLESLVNAFKGSDEIGMVRCESRIIDDKTMNNIGRFTDNHIENISYLFDECLYEKNGFWFCPGGYMTKIKIVDEVILNREIYVDKPAGQNWQMMLPILYSYKCFTIKEPLYNILSHNDSHSRADRTIEDWINTWKVHENTIVGTLERMSQLTEKDREKQKKKKKIRYILKITEFYKINGYYKEALNYYKKLNIYDVPSSYKMVFSLKYPKLYRVGRKLLQFFR